MRPNIYVMEFLSLLLFKVGWMERDLRKFSFSQEIRIAFDTVDLSWFFIDVWREKLTMCLSFSFILFF